jgi:hypothetical protein
MKPAMTITYARPPKRQRPPKAKTLRTALAAAIVTPRKRGPKPTDPEAEARAMAWIAAQLRPRGA